jgi:hypothetical protein
MGVMMSASRSGARLRPAFHADLFDRCAPNINAGCSDVNVGTVIGALGRVVPQVIVDNLAARALILTPSMPT